MRLLHNYIQLDFPSGLFHTDNRCWQESFEISWHIGRQNCDVSILGAYIEESIYSTLKDLSHKLLIYILIHTLHKIHSGRRIYFVCIYRIYTCRLAPYISICRSKLRCEMFRRFDPRLSGTPSKYQSDLYPHSSLYYTLMRYTRGRIFATTVSRMNHSTDNVSFKVTRVPVVPVRCTSIWLQEDVISHTWQGNDF